MTSRTIHNVTKKQRIGLLGGSFNPAHQGHRDMSLYALRHLDLDQVWWLVNPQNPLKASAGMATLGDRMAQAKRVVHHPRLIVTNIETQLGTRYTVDTLHALQHHFPHVQFIWLMGADNLRQIPQWRQWQDIFRAVPIAVFRRAGYPVGRGLGKAAKRFGRHWVAHERGLRRTDIKAPAWRVINNPLNPLSATDLRKEQTTWHSAKRQKSQQPN